MHDKLMLMTVEMQVRFQSGQSSTVIGLSLTSRDVSLTADLVYYVRLVDILVSDADVIGCPASIGNTPFSSSTLQAAPLFASYLLPIIHTCR